jgi:hypothetical protein
MQKIAGIFIKPLLGPGGKVSAPIFFSVGRRIDIALFSLDPFIFFQLLGHCRSPYSILIQLMIRITYNYFDLYIKGV